MSRVAVRVVTGAATAVVVVCLGAGVVAGSEEGVVTGCLALVPVAVAWVVVRNRHESPVGPALAWTSGSIALPTLASMAPSGSMIADASVGLWPLNVAGFVALLLVFPDGRRRGWFWSLVPWMFAAATAGTVFALWGASQVDGEVVGGRTGPAAAVAGIGAIAGIAACIGSGIASLVLAYRAGGERQRLQIRWLALAGIVIALLLAAGWVAETLGASLAVAYLPHLLAIVVLVPTAVGIAMVRYDLFDVDRLLSATVTWLVTLVASAAIFGVVVLVLSRAVGAGTGLGPTAAAFVTALALLPLHRFVADLVGRWVDRDRTVAVAGVHAFAADVRAGRRQPEEIEAVLRAAQRDPGLRLSLARPDGTWVDLRDGAVDDPGEFKVEAGGDVIARVRLGWDSARARRRLAALAVPAWVPIEVARLRLELRRALDDVAASRARLQDAAALERTRLERDLHDGAQQQIVASGMRLRHLQRRLDADASAEVDVVVAELESTVADLRRIAHGIRPARLADGLRPALEELRANSPCPLELEVGELPEIDESRTYTAYLVVAEAIANALKHSGASRIVVDVSASADQVVVQIRDDGRGGVSDRGLVTLRDRVAAIGGQLQVDSPVGRGTSVRAVL